MNFDIFNDVFGLNEKIYFIQNTHLFENTLVSRYLTLNFPLFLYEKK